MKRILSLIITLILIMNMVQPVSAERIATSSIRMPSITIGVGTFPGASMGVACIGYPQMRIGSAPAFLLPRTAYPYSLYVCNSTETYVKNERWSGLTSAPYTLTAAERDILGNSLGWTIATASVEFTSTGYVTVNHTEP